MWKKEIFCLLLHINFPFSVCLRNFSLIFKRVRSLTEPFPSLTIANKSHESRKQLLNYTPGFKLSVGES